MKKEDNISLVEQVLLQIVEAANILEQKSAKLLQEIPTIRDAIEIDQEASSLKNELKHSLAALKKATVELRIANEQDESSVAKYRSIFENMSDAYYEASMDGIILEISKSIEIISKGQYLREELIGRSLVSLYEHPEERDSFLAELSNTGSVNDYDISLRNRDGSIVHVAISSRILLDAGGHPSKIIGSIRDITRRKQSEIEVIRLLNNKNLLSKITKETLYARDLNNFLDSSLAEMGRSLQVSRVYMFDQDHAKGTMNNTHEWCSTGIVPQIEELQGIPASEMSWWIDLLLKENLICFSDIEEIPEESIKEILRPQNILSILIVPVMLGGRYSGFIGFDDCLTHRIWNQDEIEMLQSMSNIISGFIERKSIEEALVVSVAQLNHVNLSLEQMVEERTQENLRLTQQQAVIGENAGLAIISTDALGIIQSFNSAAELMLGYQASEVIGLRSPDIFFDPFELTQNAEELLGTDGEDNSSDFRLISNQSNLMLINTIEWIMVKKDLTRIPVKLTLSVFNGPDGNIGGYIGVAMDITQEKIALESLRISEERFHKMFHQHAAMMWLVNPVTQEIVDANLSSEKYYQYNFSKDAPIKVSEINVLDEEQMQNEINLAMSQKRNYFEFKHKLASGDIRTVEVHSSPIEVHEETLLFSIIHDITERVNSEEQLRRSEAEKKTILSAIPDLMFRLDRSGKFLSSHANNPEELLVPESAYLGKALKEVLPPHIASIAQESLEKAFLTRETVTFEYELPINGEICYYEDRIRVMSDDEALSIVRDISDRKHAEKALEWNEAFLKKMTESSPLAFLVVDNRTDEILFINHQFCEIWGINHLEADIRAKKLKNNDIIPDCIPVLKDVPAFAESCKPLQFEENRVIVEDEIPFMDGRTIRRFSTQIRDAWDQYHGRLYIFEDITARKSSEKLIETQRDLVAKLSATSDLKKALGYILDSVFQVADVHMGGIYLFNETTGDLELVGHKGVSALFAKEIFSYSFDSQHAMLVRKGKAVYGPYNKNIFPQRSKTSEDVITNLAVLPIRYEGVVIGSLNLSSDNEVGIYPHLRNAIESLALQIGGTITRIKAEKALLSSQQNFKLLFDTIDDFMFILDLQGNILQTNSEVRQRLGFSAEELFGQNVLMVHPPERREEAGFIVGEMLAGRALFCPVPLISKEGNQIPVETRVIFGKWDGQEVLFGISRDVTERQRLDAELKMQSAAFESFALPIIITDGKGKINWANSSFLNLSGYQMEEIIGKTNGELVKSGIQDESLYKKMWSTIQNGEIWSGEIYNKKKDGTIYPEEETISPVPDHLGKIRNYIAIKIDITDRKKMEVALRESEARWNFALEGSGDGVWDWNNETSEVFYSKNWKSMLGYGEHEIGNSLKEWDSRIHPDDRTTCYEDLNKHFRGEMEIYNNEHRLKCKDGNYKWILDRGKVVAWKSDGQPLRMIGTHSDISKRKEFEESLRSAIAKEKELNDLKSRFVSMASHEFRTPMASILMMSDSLISYWKRMDDHHIALKLTHIKDQVQHLAQVVTDVMQVAKIQEGKLSYVPKRVDIVGLAADVIKDFNIDDSLVTKIKFDSKWTSLDMLLDSRLMVQVLNNLLSNAIKYSLPTPVVFVKLYEQGDEILLAIKDNGIGIPKRDKKNLFQPFYRAENVKQIQGNGLGLNIVRESVMLHGGDIIFTSELMIGSTFVVHLPKTLILSL